MVTGLSSALLDNLSALVVVLDKNGQIIHFNRSCEELTGFSADEVRGRPLWEALAVQEESETLRRELLLPQADRYPNHRLMTWRTRSGERRCISSSNTAAIDGKGAITHILCTGVELKRRAGSLSQEGPTQALDEPPTASLQPPQDRRPLGSPTNPRGDTSSPAESAHCPAATAEHPASLESHTLARRLQALTRAQSAREARLEEVVYQLRTPLRLIALAVRHLPGGGLLSTHAAPGQPDARRIQLAVSQASRLVEDLFQPEELEASHWTMRLEPEDASALARDAVEMLKPFAVVRSIRLSTQLPDQRLLVVCDRARILQAITDLICGAIVHTPERGSIQVQLIPRGSEVEFAIHDSGESPLRRDEPFELERCWSTDPERPYVASLGHRLVKAIIEAHGGRLWRDPRVVVGHIVRFTLPAPASPQNQRRSSAGAGGTDPGWSARQGRRRPERAAFLGGGLR